MVGVVFLLARLARLGWIADYFSQAVLVGYITGVAIVLILGQLGKLVGISSDEDGAIGETLDIVRHLGDANGATVVVGAVSLGAAGRGRQDQQADPRRAHPRGRWASPRRGHWTSPARECRSPAPFPAACPRWRCPTCHAADLGTLVLAALAVFLVAFSDSILTSRSFAARHHEVVDANQELLAFGVAQIVGRRHPGHPGRDERVAHGGQRRHGRDQPGQRAGRRGDHRRHPDVPHRRRSSTCPRRCSARSSCMPGAKLIDPAQWRALARSSRVEVVIAAITVVCVVTIGVLQAIIVAVLLSVADIIRRAARPADAVLGWSASEDRYVDVVDHPDAGITAGVVVYRIQDRLFFANAHFFKRRLWAAVDGAPKPVRHVVLDGSFISDIDASAEVALREVIDGLRERNIELHVARAALELRERLDAVGLVETIGADHFHGTVTAAVDACRPSADTTP